MGAARDAITALVYLYAERLDAGDLARRAAHPPLATTPELQADARRAVERSLEFWWLFFDGIAAAIDAG